MLIYYAFQSVFFPGHLSLSQGATDVDQNATAAIGKTLNQSNRAGCIIIWNNTCWARLYHVGVKASGCLVPCLLFPGKWKDAEISLVATLSCMTDQYVWEPGYFFHYSLHQDDHKRKALCRATSSMWEFDTKIPYLFQIASWLHFKKKWFFPRYADLIIFVKLSSPLLCKADSLREWLPLIKLTLTLKSKLALFTRVTNWTFGHPLRPPEGYSL